MTKILITNDDGISAPGIRHLFQALKGIGELYIVAPFGQKSASGLSTTIHDPIEIHEVDWEEGTAAWAVTGTPVDCVKLGVGVLLDFIPDLIVSGINHGSNAGRNLLYSGTVGGAIEGVMRNIPGIAFSCYDFLDEPNYEQVEPFVADITRYTLDHPLPEGTVLNVNFPPKKLPIKGIKLARQGREFWSDNPRIEKEKGKTVYWIGARRATFEEHEESDIALLKQGYATVVPLKVFEMTDHSHLEERRSHFQQHFS